MESLKGQRAKQHSSLLILLNPPNFLQINCSRPSELRNEPVCRNSGGLRKGISCEMILAFGPKCGREQAGSKVEHLWRVQHVEMESSTCHLCCVAELCRRDVGDYSGWQWEALWTLRLFIKKIFQGTNRERVDQTYKAWIQAAFKPAGSALKADGCAVIVWSGCSHVINITITIVWCLVM